MMSEKRNFSGLKFVFKCSLLPAVLFMLSGCSVINFVRPEYPPLNNEITAGYYDIKIKTTTPSETIGQIILPEYELLSQTRRVIAASGEKKDGYKSWFKLAAFDENEKGAQRKYLVIVDEKPRTLFTSPLATGHIECQAVLDKNVQSAPYANQTARQIAILKDLHKRASADLTEVSEDSKTIRLCGAVLKQSLWAAITHLENSPAEAVRLDRTGVDFSQPSFNNGNILMTIKYDAATVRINLGSSTTNWKVTIEKQIQDPNTINW